MKNQLLVSDRFHADLIQRVNDSFPSDLARELIRIINIAVGGKESVDAALASCTELARQIYHFIAPDIQKAITRSARCRQAAALRKQKRAERAKEASGAGNHTSLSAHSQVMTRQMRRKQERELVKKLSRSITGTDAGAG